MFSIILSTKILLQDIISTYPPLTTEWALLHAIQSQVKETCDVYTGMRLARRKIG